VGTYEFFRATTPPDLPSLRMFSNVQFLTEIVAVLVPITPPVPEVIVILLNSELVKVRLQLDLGLNISAAIKESRRTKSSILTFCDVGAEKNPPAALVVRL
jgi:hypothetical protein